DRREARRIRAERIDLLDDRVDRRGFGQHVLEDEKLQRAEPLVEHRERGRDAQRHGEERHEREQRRVGEAAGGLGAALFPEARHQCEDEFPGGAQLLHRCSNHTVLTRIACVSLIALIVLCLAWELWLAPLRPGGSLVALKALPLALPLPGVLAGRRYT